MRYRLDVVAADVVDVVKFAGGWLFDRAMAGWDVTVLVADHPNDRPLQILGTLNSELDVRPIRHRLAERVRAHMFLRMLSYYISWHMKQALAPILFQDNDKPAAAAKRSNPVGPAQRFNEALAEAARKRATDDTPVHSFTSLLADLATICANQVQPAEDTPAFTKITSPTPVQRRAFELLDVSHRLGYT